MKEELSKKDYEGLDLSPDEVFIAAELQCDGDNELGAVEFTDTEKSAIERIA